MSGPTDSPRTPRRQRSRASLFVRIYATFVVSVLGFTLLTGLLIWLATSSWGPERITELEARIASASPALLEGLRQTERADTQLRASLAELERELDADIYVYERVRGRRLGHPRPRPEPDRAEAPPPPPPLTRQQMLQLRRGQSLVLRRGAAPPLILIPVVEGELEPLEFDEADDLDEPPADRPSKAEPEPPGADERSGSGSVVALVRIEPRTNPRKSLISIAILLLGTLAIGAWPLARSLTNRLARLERTTRAFARGDFSQRFELADATPTDEIEALGLAFNEMAERLEALLKGQQTLLANVSHELRTPIARMRVLVELLGERLARMDAQGEITDAAALARLHKGLAEMDEDLGEVDTLINDLLTSGRLELGREKALQIAELDVCELCQRAGARFDARVECEGGLQLRGDALLLERLLRNLLANARRHCPTGTLTIRALREGQATLIEVEDEGPGIPPGQRSLIFEPFTRLDAARARDQGGAGLGLYLCRQIAAAHEGTLHALERRDGRPGARFVLRI